jgi:hypothetical protein
MFGFTFAQGKIDSGVELIMTCFITTESKSLSSQWLEKSERKNK